MRERKEAATPHSPMRRVLGNFGFLIRGRGVAAVMSFGATTLMARALGPAEFGVVMLIQAYALLVRGLLNFRPFEAVVRYGVPLHDAGDHVALRRLIGIGRWVDRRAALVATAVALLAAPVVGQTLRLDHSQTLLMMGYCVVLLATGNGTANGILRLFDQFDTLGRQMAIGPTIRFVGVVLAWWLGGPLLVFVAIWALAYATENVYLSWRGWQEYRKRVGSPAIGENPREARIAEFDGLKRFLWVTYWQSNLDMVPKHISTLLAGWLLGTAEAGLLRLARELSSLLAKPAALIRQVVFLDLTRSWHQGSAAFDVIAYRTALLGGGFGLLFVAAAAFGGNALLSHLIGAKFAAAAPVLTLMLLAATFDLTGSSLRSAAYAIGRAGTVLRMYAVSAGVYLALFVALTQWLGLIGAGVAACVSAALPLLGMIWLIRTSPRNPPV
jgi:O-antigen/teichoic acid export membrane protein